MSCIPSRFLDEVDPEVVRTEAGRSYQTRSNRFQAPAANTSSYDRVDPHYYRNPLSGTSKRKRAPRRSVSEQPAPAKAEGRRVVYDEGAVEIVPGIRVEHPIFGEGKVIAMEGRGEQTKAVVFFKEAGQKKLMLRFAKLRRIG